MAEEKGMVIELKGITKRYGAVTAVEDLSFTLDGAGVYGLLGPNGAGKTTTMNILTGILAPTEGRVLCDGLDLLEEPLSVKRRMGYLPEQPPVYPELTPREYLSFVADARGCDRGRRAAVVSHALAAAGVEKVADRLTGQLSKGYRQRLGIAMALVGDPELIVLDEPTAGLDPLQIGEVRTLIRELGEHHIVLLSSHILPEIRVVADRVLILSHGKLVADEATETLTQRTESGVVHLLTVRAGERELRKALAGLKGVRSLRLERGERPGTLDAELRAKDDVTEAVSAALMDARIPVTRLETRERDLEEVFRGLTEEENNDGDL